MLSLLRLSLAIGWITALAGPVQAGLLTMEQAEELSQKTGRPIFAVAGSAT